MAVSIYIPPTVQEGFLFSTPSPTFIVCRLLMMGILTGGRQDLIIVLIFICLIKSLLMKMKKESKKAGLKLNIEKSKIMASSPITSRQIDRERMETVRDFILGGSKITSDGDCSHDIKTRLLHGRKAMTNLNSILKSRDITLPTKVPILQAMVFPVVIYGCESWPIKKLTTEEFMILNCGVGELSLRALALQRDPINQSQRK